MKKNLKTYPALVSFLLTGAFCFSALAQTKKAETVKPKVKETKVQETPAKEEAVEAKESEEKKSPSFSLGISNPHAHSIGLGVGQTFLFGKFDDYGDDRISIPDFFYNYSASHSFDFLFNIHYTKHERSRREASMLGFVPAIKAKLFQFDAFSPFVLGGVGFYLPRWSDNGNESKRKLVFGTNIGAGGDLKLNENFTIGLLFHYHNPFDVKQDVGPKVEGSYFKMLLTGMYTF